jgi:hypothetical protein
LNRAFLSKKKEKGQVEGAGGLSTQYLPAQYILELLAVTGLLIQFILCHLPARTIFQPFIEGDKLHTGIHSVATRTASAASQHPELRIPGISRCQHQVLLAVVRNTTDV